MRHPSDTASGPAPAEVAALGTLTIGCFGLTAPFSQFHAARPADGAAPAPEATGTLSALGSAIAGMIGRHRL